MAGQRIDRQRRPHIKLAFGSPLIQILRFHNVSQNLKSLHATYRSKWWLVVAGTTGSGKLLNRPMRIFSRILT